ncbi:endolytic transglycosylase MltG [Cellulomonas sp. KRMCY2]|uniref:endolytic transglycosylase MltG n=1 Tax=Cellulomonas sp. KRMCY2 TaxID=1304865 RepID=UPI00045E9FAF|nr:endolytic transglycosylase MltG [Cellulomonas sp. KRMCY2]
MNDLFLDEIVRPEQPPSGSGARSARRAEREERARSRRKRRRRSIIALVVSLGILGGGAYLVVQYVMPVISGFSLPQDEAAADYPGPGHGTVDVTIAAGSSGTQMAQVLVEAGVVQSTSAFTGAFSANPSAPSIQPGTYRLLLEMRASDAVDALLDPTYRVQVKVTFPEGERVDQMLEKLSSVTTVPVEDFQTAMADTAATGLPAEAAGNYEGWLFAATYTFEPGTTPTEMIAEMVAATVGALDERGIAPADRQRVLTIASLVEEEARTPEDRAKVARAIQNRLDIDMKLDIDASVAYGAGISGLDLTTTELAADDPYNLYTRTGLPPTPIAAPSLVSIDATLAPADGPWLFWVTVNYDTGETRFAESFDEHQANVALLREWQAANPTG